MRGNSETGHTIAAQSPGTFRKLVLIAAQRLSDGKFHSPIFSTNRLFIQVVYIDIILYHISRLISSTFSAFSITPSVRHILQNGKIDYKTVAESPKKLQNDYR